MSQHHLPGNPHFHQAGNLIGAAQADRHNEAKASIALAKATLAQTYEQRTALMMAERDRLGSKLRTHRTPQVARQYEEINKQIAERLGLGPEDAE